MGSIKFSAQYQQAPVPAGGAMIQRAWFQRWKIRPELQPGDQIVQSWDTASKENVTNDWSVCITALRRNRRQIFVLDVFRRRLDFPKLLQNVHELARRHDADVLLIEDAGSGTALIQTLRNDPRNAPRPIARKVAVSKEVRMFAQTSRIERGDLLLPEDAPWLAEFERELLAFPNGKHDDRADALAQLLDWTGLRNFDVGVIDGGKLFEGDTDHSPWLWT